MNALSKKILTIILFIVPAYTVAQSTVNGNGYEPVLYILVFSGLFFIGCFIYTIHISIKGAFTASIPLKVILVMIIEFILWPLFVFWIKLSQP